MRKTSIRIVCTMGMLFFALGGNVTAKTSEIPQAVKQALVRELGTMPKITSVKSKPAVSAKRSYDEGSIGCKLTFDQWRESQAWQALAGYNAAKQARHHDIDSMVWCTLRGGGNSGTYMKPLIDFNDHAKLSFYTFRSALQKYFASSKGVDVAYGPHDMITPVIIGLGEQRVVDLTVRCINKQGTVVSTKQFTGVKLSSGRPIVELESFRPDIKSAGYYAVTYTVTEKSKFLRRTKVLGRTFELKYFTDDSAADGNTNFIGDPTVFDTDQRLAFLKQYADQASRFFKDPNLDKKVVTDAEVKAALKKLKPQPLPEVRKRLVLNSGWKHLAYRNGETAADKRRLATWSSRGVSIKDAQLVFTRDNTQIARTFAPQDWRFFLQWKVNPVAGKTATFTVGNGKTSIVTIDIDSRGNVMVGNTKAGRIKPGTFGELKVEVDLQYNQFSLYVNGKRTIYAADIPVQVHDVTTLSISGDAGLAVDDIRGTGYDPTADDVRLSVFNIATFIDEDFAVTPDVDAWQSTSYDDSGWATGGQLPLVVGSERNKERDIYMRKTVDVPGFNQAFLNLDALDPGGEVFINGAHVATLNRQPARLDVTRFLKAGSNLIAVKVDHVPDGFYASDGHTSQDLYFGWFAGRMSLDLTSRVHVDDVYVHTEKLGDPATVNVTVDATNSGTSAFDGDAVIRLFPWYPSESSKASAVERVALRLGAGNSTTLSKTVSIPKPRLWDYEHPNLYKVTVTLVDNSGKSQDDYVVTTGIRTISEDGGTFRINGKPEVLNGGTWMQFLAPMTKSVTWHRCCPEPWIVKAILMVRAMDGTAVRIHEASGAYSNPRYAEIGDQLGIMYIWVPTGWTRKFWTKDNKHLDGSIMSLSESVDETVVDIKQVRNSPSIVMWEIFNESVGRKDADKLFDAFYPAIFKADPSRFIMPLKGYYRDEPRVVKGAQVAALGYGHKWKNLWNKSLGGLAKYENSSKCGMYAVEFAEIVGQDNWNLVKCKPWYKIYSYEWGPQVYTIDCSVNGKNMELQISEEGRILSVK